MKNLFFNAFLIVLFNINIIVCNARIFISADPSSSETKLSGFYISDNGKKHAFSDTFEVLASFGDLFIEGKIETKNTHNLCGTFTIWRSKYDQETLYYQYTPLKQNPTCKNTVISFNITDILRPDKSIFYKEVSLTNMIKPASLNKIYPSNIINFTIDVFDKQKDTIDETKIGEKE